MIDTSRPIAAGKNTYCGPYVLAGIMWCDTDEAARRVRAVCGLRAVRGLSARRLVQTLNANGYQVTHAYPHMHDAIGYTLRTWKETHPTGVYVVLVSGHFTLFANGRFTESLVHGVWVTDPPRPKRRVKGAWRIARCDT